MALTITVFVVLRAGLGGHLSPARPAPSPAATASLAGTPVPIDTLGSAYVDESHSRLLASLDLKSLVRKVRDLDSCSQTCFAGVKASKSSLFLVVQPSRTSCSVVHDVNARMLDPTDLWVLVSLKACDPGPGGGAVPEPEDLLLAVPLSGLPSGAHLTVMASAQGDETYGASPATAPITLP